MILNHLNYNKLELAANNAYIMTIMNIAVFVSHDHYIHFIAFAFSFAIGFQKGLGVTEVTAIVINWYFRCRCIHSVT